MNFMVDFKAKNLAGKAAMLHRNKNKTTFTSFQRHTILLFDSFFLFSLEKMLINSAK